MWCSLLAAGAIVATQSSQVGAAKSQSWHMVEGPSHHRILYGHVQIDEPSTDVDTWAITTGKPPVLPGQSNPRAGIYVEGLGWLRCSELADLTDQRPYLSAVLHTGTSVGSHSLAFTLGFEADLSERRLMPGAPSVAVADLPEKEKAQYLAATDRFNFTAPAFKRWLGGRKFTQNPDAGDVANEFSLYCTYRTTVTYRVIPNQDRTATAVLDRGESDCGGVAVPLVALYRSMGYPARLRTGVFASGRTGTHVTLEVFAKGVGWVPINMGAAAEERNRPDADFFGIDAGDVMVMHVDADLKTDNRLGGTRVIDWLQWPRYCVHSQSSVSGQGSSMKVTWEYGR